MKNKTIQQFTLSTAQGVKPHAFTLVEVLITIAILGVIAVLTLPTLEFSAGGKEKVTRVKKTYASLVDALDRAEIVYGDFDGWFNDLSTDDARNERFAKRITEFMKVSKDCGFSASECFSSEPMLNVFDESEILANLSESLVEVKAYTVQLPDGTSLAFYNDLENNGLYRIRIDIENMGKKENKEGSDVFNFTIYVNKSMAREVGAQINQLLPDAKPSNWKEGAMYTTAWIIEKDNVDYLKCPSELNWETNTSCN